MRDRLKSALAAAISATWFGPVHIGHFVRTRQFRRQLRKLDLGRLRKVLDAGCGSGDYALELARRCPGATITALDLRQPAAPAGAPPNIVWVQGDLRELRAVGEYDLISCIDVLEHIPGNGQVLRRFFDALAPGGTLLVHMPDDRSGRRVLPARWFAEFDEWAQVEHVGEQYTLAELVALLRSLGLAIRHAQYTFGWLGGLAWELDRLTDARWRLKILLMPLLKLLAVLSLATRPRQGSVMVLAQK
ncbi:MAG: class I SAM-dependent methyltransferase [Acidobacteriota bacterium]